MVDRLIEGAKQRKRSSDQIGWYEPQRLGVFLPDTNATGGWKFVEHVCEGISIPASEFQCKVYIYPHQSLPRRELASSTNRSSQGGAPRVHPLNRKDFDGSAIQTVISPRREETSERLVPPSALHLPAWKRALDIAGSLLGLVVLSPLFILISVIIKLVSPGPVFFRQERMGHLGRTFGMLKFRTMKVNADASMHKDYLEQLINSERPMTKLDSRHDPRIIPLGRILRKSCLDELPQLVNVLRGEMSLVGPRPCLPYEANQFLLWQTRRFDTLPGLTGLWQVSGKNRTTFLQMMRLDIGYFRRLSLWSEIGIMVKTIPAIFHQFNHKTKTKEPRGEAKVEPARKPVTFEE